MKLGEKIRTARMEAGLSQRQLCGDAITRNMLSQIEHGTARPSMDTLKYLADRLGKPVSWFLEETAVISPNTEVIRAARRSFDAGDASGALLALEQYRSPDEVYDREQVMLKALAYQTLAAQAIAQGRESYARELLGKAEGLERAAAYFRPELKRRRLLLLGRISGQDVWDRLPDLDEELLMRAEAALAAGDLNRAEHLLEAAQDHKQPRWHFLRGEVYFAGKKYAEAARCFHNALAAYPQACTLQLEICYRELGDYKRAYEYAKKQK